MAKRRLFRRRTTWEFVGGNLYIVITIGALIASAYAWSSISTGTSPKDRQLAAAEPDRGTSHSPSSFDVQSIISSESTDEDAPATEDEPPANAAPGSQTLAEATPAPAVSPPTNHPAPATQSTPTPTVAPPHGGDAGLVKSDAPIAAPLATAKPASIAAQRPRRLADVRRAVDRSEPRVTPRRNRQASFQLASARYAPSRPVGAPHRVARKRSVLVAMVSDGDGAYSPKPTDPSAMPSAPQAASAPAAPEVVAQAEQPEARRLLNFPHRMGRSTMASAAAAADSD